MFSRQARAAVAGAGPAYDGFRTVVDSLIQE